MHIEIHRWETVFHKKRLGIRYVLGHIDEVETNTKRTVRGNSYSKNVQWKDQNKAEEKPGILFQPETRRVPC